MIGTLGTKLLIGAGAFAALAAAGYGAYATIDGRGYRRGAAETEASWQAREIRQQAAAEKERKRIEDDYRARERAWSSFHQKIAEDYQKEVEDARKTKERDVAAARSGALRLRDRTASCASAGLQPDRGQPPGATSAAPVRDVHAGSELSGEASAFLLGLVDEADEVARQLGACQALIRADRTQPAR